MSERLVEVLRNEGTSENNKTFTKNGMPAYHSTLNACLDLFFLGGAYRQKKDNEVINLFSSAYREDKDLALRILAYLRDARKGVGERRFFRLCLKWIASNEKELPFNVAYLPEIGRWDDVVELIDGSKEARNQCLSVIADQLSKEKPDGLCAKWIPRKGRYARLIREFMGLYPKQFRTLLVKSTNVVESKMCEKRWKEINYSHVPSVANVKYNKAFLRNDETRRREFLQAAKSGALKINTSVAFPHTIVSMLLTRGTARLKDGELLRSLLVEDETAIAMWKQLPRDMVAKGKRILFCSDTSGSMARPYSPTDDPLKISLALGIYFSEMLTGPFQNAFITFSQNPTLQYTEGNIYERLCQIRALHPANTDLYKVFKLVLDTAVKHKLSEDELPTDICIVSDMQFDKATGYPKDDAFKLIRKMYADSGYDMPNIIFWNVNAQATNTPVERNSKGVALISGASQNALKAVLSGVTTPVDVMLNAVNAERYNKFLEPNSLRK
jgi:hypothetical protein